MLTVVHLHSSLCSMLIHNRGLGKGHNLISHGTQLTVQQMQALPYPGPQMLTAAFSKPLADRRPRAGPRGLEPRGGHDRGAPGF